VREDLEGLLGRFHDTQIQTAGVMTFEESVQMWIQVEFREGRPRRVVFTRDGVLSYWAEVAGVTREQVSPAIRFFHDGKDEDLKRTFNFTERSLAPRMSDKKVEEYFDAAHRPWWKFW
jgi:hypothetical protein